MEYVNKAWKEKNRGLLIKRQVWLNKIWGNIGSIGNEGEEIHRDNHKTKKRKDKT